jgi:hypothetical protein
LGTYFGRVFDSNANVANFASGGLDTHFSSPSIPSTDVVVLVGFVDFVDFVTPWRCVGAISLGDDGGGGVFFLKTTTPMTPRIKMHATRMRTFLPGRNDEKEDGADGAGRVPE